MTIDWWTLGFQTVNVAVLIWLLGHFFWKPVAAIIAARAAAAASLTTAAEAARAKADAARADVERTRVGFAAERETVLATAHEDASLARDAVMATARSDAAALHVTANSAIAAAREAAAAQWADRSSDLAIVIAQRLAARLDGVVVEECFLGWLAQAVRTLPAANRDDTTAAFEARTATPLDPAAQNRARTAIDSAFGRSVSVTFTSDPALIAGIELRGDHVTVDSSWRADLAAIRANLAPKAAA